MNSKSSNIIKWVVLGILMLATLVLAGLFYASIGKDGFDASTNMMLNWGYIMVFLGLLMVVISFLYTAVVKGLNWKTLLIAVVVFAIIGVVAYIMSKGSFAIPYTANEVVYSGRTHGLVEFALNFFYITFGVSLLVILFSVIYKAVKK